MDTLTTTARAAIYARISQDDRKTEKGVGRQVEDAEQLATLRGFEVVGTYTENDISAFKVRPEYERLMADAAAGRFDVIVVYSTSRLWRNRTQRGAAIDTLGRQGIRIEAVSGPSLDLASATGRYLADVIAGGDTRESEEKGERVARAAKQRAHEGRANGPVSYGWRRVYEHDDRGQVVGFHDVEDPEQAEVVRDIVRRVLAGEGLRAIARHLEASRIPTPAGGSTWRHTTVRKLVVRPSNIAKRIHHGKVIGDAEWPAIVEEADHHRAVAVLEQGTAGRRASPFPDPERRWMLTYGVGSCGVCGAVLRAQTKRSKRKRTEDVIYRLYVCDERGCVGRSVDDVDGLVGAVVVARLSRSDAAEAFSPALDGDAATARAAELRARLNGAADQYAEGLIDAEQLQRITGRLRPQIEGAESEAQRAAIPIEVPELDELRQAETAAAGWEEMGVDRRRAVLEVLGMTVAIMPTRQGPGFRPQDVHIGWGDHAK